MLAVKGHAGERGGMVLFRVRMVYGNGMVL